MLEYRVEPLTPAVIEEMAAHEQEYWQETEAHYRKFPLKMKWHIFLKAQDIGSLRMVTIRDNAVLKGMGLFGNSIRRSARPQRFRRECCVEAGACAPTQLFAAADYSISCWPLALHFVYRTDRKVKFRDSNDRKFESPASAEAGDSYDRTVNSIIFVTT